MATVWLVAVVATFLAGGDTLGFILGVPLLVVAAVVTTINWCLPSLIYGLVGRGLRGSTA